jgi:uncharacterized membrane protein
LDIIEKTVLSVALSLSVVGISGLYLGLSSVGITVSSVTESLSLIVIILAFLAMLRKMGLIRLPSRKRIQNQSISANNEFTLALPDVDLNGIRRA